MNAVFKTGDKIQKDRNSNIFTVVDVDTYRHPIPCYCIENNGIQVWDYCLCWKKVSDK